MKFKHKQAFEFGSTTSTQIENEVRNRDIFVNNEKVKLHNVEDSTLISFKSKVNGFHNGNQTFSNEKKNDLNPRAELIRRKENFALNLVKRAFGQSL